MPIRAKIYASTIVAAGAITLAFAAAQWTCQSPTRFLACLCLALLGSTFKVKLPGMDSCITPSFIPFLFAAGTMSWPETAVIAAFSGILQTLWKPKRRPAPIQAFFNGANLAIAIAIGFAVSHAAAPDRISVQLVITVIVFEVLNTLSVSTVVGLITGSSLSGIWRNCHLWTFPFHLVGAALAAVWAQSELALSVSVTVFGAVTLYLMSAFYQELVRHNTPTEVLAS